MAFQNVTRVLHDIDGHEVDGMNASWKSWIAAEKRMSATERLRLRDRRRTALQTPIASAKYRVIYVVGGKERKSSWLYTEQRAKKAFDLMQAKHGQSSAIIYMD